MPTKFSTQQVYCFPCRYQERQMLRSGRPAIWRYTCQHNAFRGRTIETGELVPYWCPLKSRTEGSNKGEK